MNYYVQKLTYINKEECNYDQTSRKYVELVDLNNFYHIFMKLSTKLNQVIF